MQRLGILRGTGRVPLSELPRWYLHSIIISMYNHQHFVNFIWVRFVAMVASARSLVRIARLWIDRPSVVEAGIYTLPTTRKTICYKCLTKFQLKKTKWYFCENRYYSLEFLSIFLKDVSILIRRSCRDPTFRRSYMTNFRTLRLHIRPQTKETWASRSLCHT
jgi:hypothetical protein